MTQKKNKKRNPMAIQLKHWRHQVIKNKQEREENEAYLKEIKDKL